MAGKKTKKEKPEKIEPSLDPLLPLPAGTGIPYLKNGEGAEILQDSDHIRTVEMTYRAFYVTWEQVEALAKKNYERYIGGPMEGSALAALEAVQAFRSAFWRREIPTLSESEARAIREAEKSGKTKKGAQTSGADVNHLSTDQCSHDGFVKKVKTKSGEKLWKCENCGLKWPRTSSGEARSKPSKGRKAKTEGSNGSKPDSSAKKNGKKALKKKSKKQKQGSK